MDVATEIPAGTAVERQPYGYHLSLCPAMPEPAFEDPGELERVWGRSWGAHDEVGKLARRADASAGRGVVGGSADAWNEAAGALVDPDGMWYWESRTPPDLELVAAQHRGLVEALQQHGVDVVLVQERGPSHLTRPIYTRDPLVTVPAVRSSVGWRRRCGGARSRWLRERWPAPGCRSCRRSPAPG